MMAASMCVQQSTRSAWLQVKCLRVLQYFPVPDDPAVNKGLENVLKRIITGDLSAMWSALLLIDGSNPKGLMSTLSVAARLHAAVLLDWLLASAAQLVLMKTRDAERCKLACLCNTVLLVLDAEVVGKVSAQTRLLLLCCLTCIFLQAAGSAAHKSLHEQRS